jgi:hypothetical protein
LEKSLEKTWETASQPPPERKHIVACNQRFIGFTTMEGYLLKKGNDFIGLVKRRWFVLSTQPHRLSYYLEPNGALKGNIPLTVAEACASMGRSQDAASARAAGQRIDCRPVGLGGGTKFEVRTPGRVYILDANSPDECNRWLRAIQDASDAAEAIATGGVPPLPPVASSAAASAPTFASSTVPPAPQEQQEGSTHELSVPIAAPEVAYIVQQQAAPPPPPTSIASSTATETTVTAVAATHISPPLIDPSGMCAPLSTSPVPEIDKSGMSMAQKIEIAQRPPTEALTFNPRGELVFSTPIRLRVANNPFTTTHKEWYIMSEADRNIIKAVVSPDQKSIRMFATETPLVRMDGSQGQELYSFSRGGVFGSGAWTVRAATTGAQLFTIDAQTTFSKHIVYSVKPLVGGVDAMKMEGDWFRFAAMTVKTNSGALVAEVGTSQDILAKTWATIQPGHNVLVVLAVTFTALLDADARAAKIDRQFNKGTY